ncbi:MULTISPECIES: polyprenol monophosphomannose synthase [Persicobacter]|uniref:Dolichol-phosphate mannosyltransferase n=1 Tax=Persicobacter diffluens TaxID=981 RepID=A0AAN5AMK4_9BACT|nr:polyprenol monophosphomannose synthase [Persicobacter sp. CCB-QB2]GJM61948.1 dolichol-phosphate mannosyltransferase [Persicobacter diffluens]
MSKNIVIIPTYNEKENIEAIIRKVFSLEVDFHILIVDDGSPDGTAIIVKKLQQEFGQRLHLIERSGKLGLGTAYITGFKYCLEQGYDFVYEMDADFSHNPEDLVRLYNACAVEGADMSIGSRYVSGVNVVNWPMKRVLMSYFASKYVQFITGIPFNDTTAGFVCYSRRVLQHMDLEKIKFVGYAFQIEMKFTIWKHGFNIVEVPIVFTDRTQGESKMSGGIFKEAVFGVIKMKLSSFFRKYEPCSLPKHAVVEAASEIEEKKEEASLVEA